MPEIAHTLYGCYSGEEFNTTQGAHVTTEFLQHLLTFGKPFEEVVTTMDVELEP